MEIRELKCFHTVADVGSVTHASDKLHITQPALSRTIKGLEDKFGVTLFERNGRGLALTEAGKHLYRHVQQILRLIDDTQEALAGYADTIRGDVTIGVPPSMFAFTPGLLTRLREIHPHISIRILEGFNDYLKNWLLDGSVDVAILNARSSDLSKCKSTRIATDRLYVIERPGFLATRVTTASRGVSFKLLGQLPVLLPTRMSGVRKIFDQASASAGIEIRPVHELDSVSAIKELVLRGEGVAILPLASIARELHAGLFCAARLTRPEVHRELIVATTTARAISPAVRTVEKTIADDFIEIVDSLSYSLGFSRSP